MHKCWCSVKVLHLYISTSTRQKSPSIKVDWTVRVRKWICRGNSISGFVPFSYLGRSQHWSPYKGIGVPWCDFISRCCKIVFMIMNRRNCTLCEFYLFHVECRTKLLKLSGKLSTTVHTNHHSEIEETGAKGQIGQSFREVSRTWAISFHDLHHQQFARGIRLEK